MLTAALILLAVLLAVALGVVCLLWRAAVLEIRVQERRIRGLRRRLVSYQTELDALSIAPPRIDTRTGSHDALPIRDDIRATLTAYCEGMWHQPTTNNRNN